MRLLSVNVGTPRPDGDRRAKTGIFKEPTTGPVEIGPLGMSGDAVLDKKHHGGPDQALYLYAAEDYAWWSEELGRRLEPGTFGENLTTEGLDVSALAVGDRLTFGAVETQVTAPRIPCATLARRMEDEGFVKRFLLAHRPGAYLRVLRPGTLREGNPASLVRYEGERLGLIELVEDFRRLKRTEAAIRRILSAPVAERLRATKEAQLAGILAKKFGKSSGLEEV